MSSPERSQSNDQGGGFLDTFAGTEADDQLTGHSYDGIEEFDNPLPGWWKWLFVATILFAGPYWLYFHAGNPNRTPSARYAAAAARNARLQFGTIGELAGDAPTLVKYMHDKNWIRVGEGVFKANCISCHAVNGGGLVGPNLTDNAYKNIRSIEDLYTVVNNGAAAGAMPAWKNRLEQNERVLVAAYVASLRGADPGPNAKAPEGQPIAPWPEYVEPEPTEAADAADPENEPAGDQATPADDQN